MVNRASSRTGGCDLSDADIDDAVRILNDPMTTWHSADDVLLRVARDGLAAAREERGGGPPGSQSRCRLALDWFRALLR